MIDAGLVTSLNPENRNIFGNFLRALCAGDTDTLVTTLVQLNSSKIPVDEMVYTEVRMVL